MDSKLQTITNLFEGKTIRSIWDSEKEDYYFSVVDVISALAETKDASDYWTTLKRRLINRGTESKDKVLSRFKTAYQEINELSKYNYVVVNDEVELATKKIEAIMLAEKCRVDRIEEVDLYNNEEEIH